METYCDCNTCMIASCEERNYSEEEIDIEYEYEKAMDAKFDRMFGSDPFWSK